MSISEGRGRSGADAAASGARCFRPKWWRWGDRQSRAAPACRPAAVEAPPAAHPAALPAAPQPAAPARVAVGTALERDGFAAVRLGGEVLLVDLLHHDVAPDARTVRLLQDGHISVGTVDKWAEARHADRRAGLETLPRSLPGSSATLFQDLVRVIGTVIASQPAVVLDEEDRVPPCAATPPRSRKAPRADLAAVEICGTATGISRLPRRGRQGRSFVWELSRLD